MQLERTRRMPLSELVLEQLLGQLRSGTIRPGDRLPGEHDLMRMLGVGRSSVREALRWLITLGVVETKAGRGAVIVARSPVPFPQSDVTDVFQKWAVLDLLEVRESLEGQAAALAARRATALDLATLERHALEIERLVAERRTYFRANAAFHAAVARASHNNVLAGCVERLVGQVRLYRQRLMREIQGMPEGDVAEHQAVLDAIRACEPERARTAMIAHIRRFAGVVRALDQPSGRGHPAREGDGHPRATVGAPDRRGRVREHTDRP